MALYKEHC